ncbi:MULTISPECIES: hemin-degrading factor [unclassified Yoonia]|uniref:hemin-degrading factor n=1 Tax=unclassified Yoonia TaxID=2629118 RepID=UPI002AFDD724|nr:MULTISPECIES: ChuX/HutX family heme-like substrate-binding protein [unclassified Yoonia]
MILSPSRAEAIAAARADKPKMRERDLAESLGIREAEILAADLGHGVRRIVADPAQLLPRVEALGDVMALTRNDHCVHERRGIYTGFHAGAHAAMVLGDDIDLRIFPRHWVHAFAVERAGADGTKRSLQVFDAAGDAVHKIHLGPDSDIAAFDALVADLALADDAPFDLDPRAIVEPVRVNVDKLDELRSHWVAMTDTHQFVPLTKRLNFDRLGANRSIGAPWAVQLPVTALEDALHQAAARALQIMIFVGNRGCIQIHSGTVQRLEPMGPWFNVLDPRFNLHLRADKVAEVWLVRKPSKRGDAISVEAFDADGQLILQIFGKRAEAATDTKGWDQLADTLAGGVMA